MRCTYGYSLIVVVIVLITTPFQLHPSQRDGSAVAKRLRHTLELFEKLPPSSKLLSAPNVDFNALSKWASQPQIPIGKSDGESDNVSILASPASALTGSVPTVVAVAGPRGDFLFSRFAGFTQSESSTALCGDTAVIGFNDTGSIFETLTSGSGAISIAGIAVSNDHGLSFRDMGSLPPGANPANLLQGSPVLACADSSRFYVSEVFLTADSSGNSFMDMALSISSDGGMSWSDPAPAVIKDGSMHFFSKGWMAIDPSDAKRVYVAYTDVDTSFASPFCGNQFRTGIEFVQSNDGGNSFSNPTIIDQVCGLTDTLDNPHLVVGSLGRVFAAWVKYNSFPTGPREIRFTSFAPSEPPAPFVKVDDIVAGGDTFVLQGGFRNTYGVDLAVDRSGGLSDGVLYVTWDDGRDKSVPDVTSQTGTYAFDDILLRQSFDHGRTWGSRPLKINSDVQPPQGPGHDHFQPGIAVDSDGKLAACWYDRRNDPENFKIERWCATSVDQGLTWNNFRVPAPGFAPVHGIDSVINPLYMGDYDGLTSDFIHTNKGFLGGFQSMDSGSNSDVKAVSFR